MSIGIVAVFHNVGYEIAADSDLIARILKTIDDLSDLRMQSWPNGFGFWLRIFFRFGCGFRILDKHTAKSGFLFLGKQRTRLIAPAAGCTLSVHEPGTQHLNEGLILGLTEPIQKHQA